MRVACYLRVSTIDQVEGFSLDVQRDRLVAYCKSQGWDDYTLYMDEGESATTINRPGMNKLIRHIEEKRIDAVVVMKLDRLSRKQKHVLYLLEDVFEKNGVIFRSSTEPFDTSSAFGKASIGMLAVFAQLERDMIVERTVSGKLQRIRSGKWHGGQAPFGYQWPEEGDDLVIVPDEAETVREIFRRYIDGDSYSSLSRWAQEKHPSYTFEASIIKRIVSRHAYAGLMYYSGKVYESSTEAIIDDKTWEESQRELKRRDDGLPPRGEYLLTGLCRCGLCGSFVVHETKQHKHKRTGKIYYKDYICCKNQKYKPYECNMGYHRRLDVEAYIVNQIKTISADPSHIQSKLESDNEEDRSDIIKALESRVKSAETGLENLMEAIQLGVVKATAVAKRIKDLEEEKEAAETSLEEILDREQPVRETIDVSFIQEIGDVWDDLTEEEQKIVLRKLIISVKINQRGQEPEIMWNLTP